MNPNVSLLQTLVQSVCSSVDFFLFAFEGNWHDDDLDIGCSWGQDQAFIITMIHGHDSDRAGCKTPTGLPHKLLLLLLIFEDDVEHFGEVLAEVVGGSCLNGSSVFGNPGLDC